MPLNEYIIANAGKINDASCLSRFDASEVYFSFDSSDDLKGGPLDVSANIALKIRTANINIGYMALFYTSKNDSRLSNRFAGMPLIRAIEMVCNMPEVDGILIQSDGDAWFAVPKDTLMAFLNQKLPRTRRLDKT